MSHKLEPIGKKWVGVEVLKRDVIIAFKESNQGHPACISCKAFAHAMVAVKISTYNKLPVPGHLIHNCHIKLINSEIVCIKNVHVVDFTTHSFLTVLRSKVTCDKLWSF